MILWLVSRPVIHEVHGGKIPQENRSLVPLARETPTRRILAHDCDLMHGRPRSPIHLLYLITNISSSSPFPHLAFDLSIETLFFHHFLPS